MFWRYNSKADAGLETNSLTQSDSCSTSDKLELLQTMPLLTRSNLRKCSLYCCEHNDFNGLFFNQLALLRKPAANLLHEGCLPFHCCKIMITTAQPFGWCWSSNWTNTVPSFMIINYIPWNFTEPCQICGDKCYDAMDVVMPARSCRKWWPSYTSPIFHVVSQQGSHSYSRSGSRWSKNCTLMLSFIGVMSWISCMDKVKWKAWLVDGLQRKNLWL